ncbi:YceI family protein [Dyella sp. ASV21]|uniref:YceI family protein n=1 Tax=Dyella sp. ASV21 TaxID=2795114 RepID=UPI0018ED93EF|nr:YceI family protein [Dyella sp. ASV21]
MSHLRRFNRWFFALACAWLPLAAAHAAPTMFRYDTTHSQILFSIDHNGFSRPFGRLHIARGWLRFDPDNWSQSSTELDIDLASLDMGDAEWNAAVLKPAFLDSATARYAHFVSTAVEQTDSTHGLLHGNLNLRGVTRPVTVSFTFNRLGATIYGLHTAVGFSATTQLQRDDFGITANANSIGHNVSIWLVLEAIEDKHDSTNKEHP